MRALDCPVMLGPREIGRLRWRQEGTRYAFDASCESERGYIYRLALMLPGGGRTLGVMLPEGGRFCLRKTLALPAPPRGARILRALPGEEAAPPLPFPFSRLTEYEAASLVRDELFLRLCPERVLAAEEEGLRWLALPLRAGEESALAPFFCLCAPLQARGESWALLCADGEGALRLPPASDSLCAAHGL